MVTLGGNRQRYSSLTDGKVLCNDVMLREGMWHIPSTIGMCASEVKVCWSLFLHV